MSAIGGIYNYAGANVNKFALDTLNQGLSNRWPYDGKKVITGSIGMIHRSYDATKVSLLGQQPYIDFDNFIVAWDGRLDNREELINNIGERLNGGFTIPEIILASYLKVGSDFIKHLIGDFVLALWDPREKALLIGRDIIGCRPLYYYFTKESIVWSSDVSSLLPLLDTSPEIDENYIADYLVTETKPNATAIKGIMAAPPGHLITIQNSQLKLQRYWTPDPNKTIRYKNDQEYEEHFRHLFRESVRCNMESRGQVFAELSGGLDSSSIVCMGDEIINSGELTGVKLSTISYVYNNSATSDDTKYIQYVEEKRQIKGSYLYENAINLGAPPEGDPTFSFPCNSICYSRLYSLIDNIVLDGKSSVLLSGHAGDHIMRSGIDELPDLGDLFSQYKIGKLHRKLQEWSMTTKRSYLNLLWSEAIWPNVSPSRIYESTSAEFVPKWIDQEFSSKMSIRERSRTSLYDYGLKLPSGRVLGISLTDSIHGIVANSVREASQVERRYPYLYKPLLEFIFAIPYEQLIRPNQTRSLHRRSMKGILPEAVRRRNSKALVDEALFRGISREWLNYQKIFDNPYISTMGFVNKDHLWDALIRARHGHETNAFRLLRTITLEFWLRGITHLLSNYPNTANLQTQVRAI